MNIEFPNWLPHEVKEWFSRAKAVTARNSRYARLSTDPRMSDVWKWFESGRRMIDEEVVSPTDFLINLEDAAYFPGKPSDMPPKQRAAYLEKVRKHAEILIDLLNCTQFDEGPLLMPPPSIPPEEAESAVLEDLRGAIGWSQGGMGREMLAYETNDDGSIVKHARNYPENVLVESLHNLINWTKQDDRYSPLFSVKPVRQSGASGRKSAYLARLYMRLEKYSLDMPFAHYASAANVALDLLGDDELDEDSARTKIRRMQERGDLDDPDDLEWLPF